MKYIHSETSELSNMSDNYNEFKEFWDLIETDVKEEENTTEDLPHKRI